VLHLFCRLRRAPEGIGHGIPHASVRANLERAVDGATAEGYTIVPIAILGHKADVCFMVVGDDVWHLRRFQSAVQDAGLDVVDSYVSLTEVSEYADGISDGMKRARLYPTLPIEGKTAWCFYPMTKRRDAVNNWYSLPFEERKEFMMQHGESGREFAERVTQLVTGSTGIDDWEWGVTLFARTPDDLKAVVYTMRFDEASTLYAEFGTFYTGVVGVLHDVLTAAGVYRSLVCAQFLSYRGRN